ncbi:MAG TPA: FKBP-type peptidyl-prolyl cis-trans isomerase [Vicinamibacterales bacterium]|jgi:peptidylprolyl isomerase
MDPVPRFAAVLLLSVLAAACAPRDERSAPADVAGPPADAIRTPSGLASKVLRVGLGQTHPRPQSMVTVHYTGWTTDGRMFDSSLTEGKPITFQVTQVIPGWVEGLQLMREGEKRRFWIPGALGYDNDPRQDVPKGMLVFDIELIRVR